MIYTLRMDDEYFYVYHKKENRKVVEMNRKDIDLPFAVKMVNAFNDNHNREK